MVHLKSWAALANPATAAEIWTPKGPGLRPVSGKRHPWFKNKNLPRPELCAPGFWGDPNVTAMNVVQENAITRQANAIVGQMSREHVVTDAEKTTGVSRAVVDAGLAIVDRPRKANSVTWRPVSVHANRGLEASPVIYANRYWRYSAAGCICKYLPLSFEFFVQYNAC
ncbi:hypothetical protein TNIN_382081 [Trichonephila inaurata madagascariensis]|uniref:Uncharacterized protein n=1 Tax=Trichonephila inaurata madagascariensis TaxID=2747483 RepID=A0A8X7BPY8_9ARAC|nr:hypothetical protein TNIN_382081 [Trichonephila inaurata madagascariensis]